MLNVTLVATTDRQLEQSLHAAAMQVSPADAAHLRFVVGGLGRQTRLLPLIGNLKIDVLSVNAASGPTRSK